MGLNFLPKSKRVVAGRARARRSLAAAGGLLAATLAAVPAVRAEISSPLVAGLPWRSGATVGGFPCLADLRHRALDAVNVYLAPQTFTDNGDEFRQLDPAIRHQGAARGGADGPAAGAEQGP